MDDTARQDEYDANVDAVKAALAHCSREELLHIAATQIVNGLYVESTHRKETTALHTAIAFHEEAQQGLERVHRAERDQRAQQTVQHLISLMPDMEGMARQRNAKRALDLRYAKDPKQAVKAVIKEEWLRLRAERGKGRWFAKFARDQHETYKDVLEDPDKIRQWTVDWEKEYLHALQKD